MHFVYLLNNYSDKPDDIAINTLAKLLYPFILVLYYSCLLSIFVWKMLCKSCNLIVSAIRMCFPNPIILKDVPRYSEEELRRMASIEHRRADVQARRLKLQQAGKL